MSKQLLFAFILNAFNFSFCFSQPQTLFETSQGKKTDTYQQVIKFYQHLDKTSSLFSLKQMGLTDAGFPLHVALYSNDGITDPVKWRSEKKDSHSH